VRKFNEYIAYIIETTTQRERILHHYRKANAELIRELVASWKCPYGTADMPEKCKTERVKSVEECENCWVEYCSHLDD